MTGQKEESRGENMLYQVPGGKRIKMETRES
jgi:hypothetical protein